MNLYPILFWWFILTKLYFFLEYTFESLIHILATKCEQSILPFEKGIIKIISAACRQSESESKPRDSWMDLNNDSLHIILFHYIFTLCIHIIYTH